MTEEWRSFDPTGFFPTAYGDGTTDTTTGINMAGTGGGVSYSYNNAVPPPVTPQNRNSVQLNQPLPYSPAPQYMSSQSMPSNQSYVAGIASIWTGSFDDEPPLLEELEINFNHILTKTLAVLNPLRKIDPHIMDDTDLAGPLVFAILLGFFLLLTGKVHFGYIYGVGFVGCLSIYAVLNLMSEAGVDIYRSVSVLGYCLLPMVILAGVSVILPLNGVMGYVLAGLTIMWCTNSAAFMFVAVLNLKEQTPLILYPIGLVYTCFALLTIF